MSGLPACRWSGRARWAAVGSAPRARTTSTFRMSSPARHVSWDGGLMMNWQVRERKTSSSSSFFAYPSLFSLSYHGTSQRSYFTHFMSWHAFILLPRQDQIVLFKPITAWHLLSLSITRCYDSAFLALSTSTQPQKWHSSLCSSLLFALLCPSGCFDSDL